MGDLETWDYCRTVSLQWRHNERDGVSNLGVSFVCSAVFFFRQIKCNTKAPCQWSLWGESTGDRWIPLIKGPVTRKMFPFDNVIRWILRASNFHNLAEITMIYWIRFFFIRIVLQKAKLWELSGRWEVVDVRATRKSTCCLQIYVLSVNARVTMVTGPLTDRTLLYHQSTV